MSIKAKQVAGVTTLVVVVVAVLSAYHLATLTRLRLEDTASRGEVLANAIFLRAADVVAQGGADPYAALHDDGGIRSILQASVGYSPNVIYAMILNKDSPEMMAKVDPFFRTLVADAKAQGYGEYRTHLDYMDLVADTYDWNGGALRKLNERVKDALDPNGILAPGKSGIWPKGQGRRA